MTIVHGFDAVDMFDDQTLKDMRGTYDVAGFYLGGPKAATAHPVYYSNTLRATGYLLAPIYVGLQLSDLAPLSTKYATGRGASDALECLSLAARHGIPKLHPVILDWEGGASSPGSAYCNALITGVRRGGFNPIQYRPQSGPVDFAPVWLADPNSDSSSWQPSSTEVGLQYEFDVNGTIDLSLWELSIWAAVMPTRKQDRMVIVTCSTPGHPTYATLGDASFQVDTAQDVGALKGQGAVVVILEPNTFANYETAIGHGTSGAPLAIEAKPDTGGNNE